MQGVNQDPLDRPGARVVLHALLSQAQHATVRAHGQARRAYTHPALRAAKQEVPVGAADREAGADVGQEQRDLPLLAAGRRLLGLRLRGLRAPRRRGGLGRRRRLHAATPQRLLGGGPGRPGQGGGERSGGRAPGLGSSASAAGLRLSALGNWTVAVSADCQGGNTSKCRYGPSQGVAIG